MVWGWFVEGPGWSGDGFEMVWSGLGMGDPGRVPGSMGMAGNLPASGFLIKEAVGRFSGVPQGSARFREFFLESLLKSL